MFRKITRPESTWTCVDDLTPPTHEGLATLYVGNPTINGPITSEQEGAVQES